MVFTKKKETIVQKVSFPWIAIQKLNEEDDSFHIKYKLIQNVLEENESKTSHVVDQSDGILKAFIKFFSYEKYFNLQAGEESSSSNHQASNGKKKKKKGMNKEEFQENLGQLFQEADFKEFSLEKFQFQNKKFKFKICNYLYIFYWCIEILRALKVGKKVPQLILLDAVLSINRLIQKQDITNENYRKGFLFVQKKMNSIVNEKFYELLFSNPKYLIHSSFQNLDTEIKLYKEQIEMIQDILNMIDQDQPLLFANQHPTGQGKTFNCAPLCKIMSKKYNNHLTFDSRNTSQAKCILFACSNGLVRNQLAADILIADDLHLWLAKHAMIVDNQGKKKDKFLIRPYKSCFPSNWKKKYKDEDEKKIGSLESQWEYYTKATQRIPNIIIADLECCRELLKTEFNEIFVAYIDEFVTDTHDAKIMAEICTLLPKQSILLSSVFPKFENIPCIVNQFCSRHHTTVEKSCKRVSSSNIRIPVAIIDPEGFVKFPHHYIGTVEELQLLIEYIKKDPRVRRSYPCSYVYYWSKTIQEFLPEELHFEKFFPNIGSINQNDSCNYVNLLLDFLLENFDLLEKFQEYSPKKMNQINPDDIFTKETYQFEVEGKTLCIFIQPSQDVSKLTRELFQGYEKVDHLVKMLDNEKKALEKNLSSLKKASSKQDRENFDKVYNQTSIQELEAQIDNMKISIPNKMILNHTEHFKRFHPKHTDTLPKTISMKNGLFLSNNYFDHFNDLDLYQIFSGIGVYDYENQTKHQRELIMQMYQYFLFFCSGKQIIYGTNLANLCNIFLPSIIAKNLSIPELYQLLGRVGRPGASNHANIITTDFETTKLLLSIDDTYEKETDVEKEIEKLIQI